MAAIFVHVRKIPTHQSEPLAIMKAGSLHWARMQLNEKACLSGSIIAQLNRFFAVEQVHSSPTFKVLSANQQGAFCLGADLTLLSQLAQLRDVTGLQRYASDYLSLVDQMLSGKKDNVTCISVVQGQAIGAGMFMALAADIVIAEPQAEFMNSNILCGEYPSSVFAKKLKRKASLNTIMEVLCSGKRVSAETLYELGLVDILCEKDHAEKAVYELIARIKSSSHGHLALQKYRADHSGLSRKTKKFLADKWVANFTNGDSRLIHYMRRLGRLQGE
ncbi:enoyl-CoA hydratase-related protein [Pseudoalteromonas sp. SMS1]|uniref:enoyl-CoA hydratase-related protein n=1 Tax=Pseudoalteromonas sp. SMS1 TaxID=2908894 RepID=UPI001F448FEC|nr:enoyl-CoA hydratase-related protein [Pseudoalteromonas sp. SMS1]MCF2858024.1 enoyl-CoA hydratase-related protein [Pseudoalteromonas sp. SMS1]